jgi:large subunit ribosomal protein L31
MKTDIHPDYHDITVIMTDGSSHVFRSTMGKAGDVLRLDVDPKTHPAWTGGAQQIVRAGQMDRFQKKFANFGMATSTAADKKAAQK